MKTITPENIIKEGTFLTVGIAKSLKGKKIAYTSPEYRGNEMQVKEVVIGGVSNEWDLAAKDKCEGFENRQEYWKTYFTESQIKDHKNRYQLVDEDGVKVTGCRVIDWHYNEYSNIPVNDWVFEGSDEGRCVSFITLD